MYQKSILFLLTLVLFGCAKNNVEYRALLNNPGMALKSYASLTPVNIELNKETDVNLGDKNQEIMKYGKDKVFASKLVLPTMKRAFSLDVYSGSIAGFFAPKILFLNKSYQVVKRSKTEDFNFDRGFFKGTIFINKRYTEIKYIVVTQDLKAISKKYHVNYVTATPITIPVGPYMATYITSSGDQNRTIKNACGGNVEVTVKPYSPNSIYDKK